MSVQRRFAERNNNLVNVIPELATSGYWFGYYLLKIDPTNCSVFNVDITELETSGEYYLGDDENYVVDPYGYTNNYVTVPIINTALIIDPTIASIPDLKFTINFVNMNDNDTSVFVCLTATSNGYINKLVSLVSPLEVFYKSRIQSLTLKSNGTMFALVSCGVTPWYNDRLIVKDMSNYDYDDTFDPYNYQGDFFSGMADFIEDNIVQGDKSSNNRFIASYWNDWGNDIFDSWGYFYLYDVTSGKYYFPLFTPQNQADGILTRQTFNVFDRTFTITHGYAMRGIFKFDISVNDSLPFRFGAYGNMGSDGREDIEDLTYSSTIGGNDLTLYYQRHAENGEDFEILYSYWIPKKLSDNSSITYDFNNYGENNSIKSNEITKGLIVYFSKTYDVKEWVENDLQNLVLV